MDPNETTVRLGGDASASAFLARRLQDAAERFPAPFAGLELPSDASRFRRTYPDLLADFEARRAAAPERVEIARAMAADTRAALCFGTAERSVPLSDALNEPAPPLPLVEESAARWLGWTPSFVYRGQRHQGTAIADVAQALADRALITAPAAQALRGLLRERFTDGTVDLRGRSVVALGAGAEMAATRHFLEAGADLLWLDRVPVPDELRASGRAGGRLLTTEQPVDLLRRPAEALAAIRHYAGTEGPVDLCLYAYAPGQLRELTLTGVMNAIVDALDPSLVASITLLVSPTTPIALTPQDVEAITDRHARRPGWEALLASIGLLGRGAGHVSAGGGNAIRSVVAIQGASYQAAQYLGKVLQAEAWADPAGPSRRVSANTAAITKTRSLDHPVFAAAFGGAGAFGVETFTPRQSRCLNGLLTVADWLSETLPEPGRVRVHGGIHTLPYPLEPALRMAATFGFARSPRLLRGLLQR